MLCIQGSLFFLVFLWEKFMLGFRPSQKPSFYIEGVVRRCIFKGKGESRQGKLEKNTRRVGMTAAYAVKL